MTNSNASPLRKQPEPEPEPKPYLEDKDKSSSSKADKKYYKFLDAHPKPRDSQKGKSAFLQALEKGVDPDLIISAATAYRTRTDNYDESCIISADNWLSNCRWEEFKPPARQSTEQEINENIARHIKDGKIHLIRTVSPTKLRQIVDQGLVTQEQCENARLSL